MSQTFSCSLYEMVVWLYEMDNHFFPVNSLKIALPIFRSTPALEVGIPVALAILCFVCVIPNARFHEKLRCIPQQFSLNRRILLFYVLFFLNAHRIQFCKGRDFLLCFFAFIDKIFVIS